MPAGGKRPGSGGARPGGGRPSKAKELGLIGIMDKIGPSEPILMQLYAIASSPTDKDHPFDKNKMEATKLWLAYKYGRPAESVAFTGQIDLPVIIKTHKTE